MSVVVRFAPSPTGFLHIGGGRTALFNWLFARHHGGKFRLRIEDTDRQRSTEAAIEAIFDGMRWLGLDWDDEVVFQFARAGRHAEVAQKMLAEGKAYYCYCTPEELESLRATAKAAGKPWRYDGRWRDRDPSEAPAGVKPVIRFKAPREGATTIDDMVQGPVTVQNQELDDLIILRADGTPTYNLSVVVDDHDMGITHVIRGDDHLTNAFRQTQLYIAAGFATPKFAHIPLIHGPDGAKLSKRHGALGVDAYRDMGYLPEAMRNYLLRLGWGHGNDEIISTEQAIEWFDLDGAGRSPSRFDFVKLESLNAHYLRQADDDRLVGETMARLKAEGVDVRSKLKRLMPALKERSKTLVELAEGAAFLVAPRPLVPDQAAARLLAEAGREILGGIIDALRAVDPWTAQGTEAAIRGFAESRGLKLGKVAQPLRAGLTGRAVSPPVFDVLAAFGKEESLGRLAEAAA